MTSGPEAALDRLLAATADGTLDEICRRRQVRVLGAFGSAASTGAATAADLDLGVGFLPGRGDVLATLDDLVELAGWDRIDLAVIDGADPALRARALSGLGLFEHEAGGYATEQMAALAEARDTAWPRRLDLDTLTR